MQENDGARLMGELILTRFSESISVPSVCSVGNLSDSACSVNSVGQSTRFRVHAFFTKQAFSAIELPSILQAIS